MAEGLNLLLERWMEWRGARVAVLALPVPLVALLGRGLPAALMVFALIGVIFNGIENAYRAYWLACASREEHTALLYLASAPRAVWPLVGAAIAEGFGYRTLFLVTAGFLLLAVWSAFRLPRTLELD